MLPKHKEKHKYYCYVLFHFTSNEMAFNEELFLFADIIPNNWKNFINIQTRLSYGKRGKINLYI